MAVPVLRPCIWRHSCIPHCATSTTFNPQLSTLNPQPSPPSPTETFPEALQEYMLNLVCGAAHFFLKLHPHILKPPRFSPLYSPIHRGLPRGAT